MTTIKDDILKLKSIRDEIAELKRKISGLEEKEFNTVKQLISLAEDAEIYNKAFLYGDKVIIVQFDFDDAWVEIEEYKIDKPKNDIDQHNH